MRKQRWEESEKRREEKKKEDQRRERLRRKKMQVREKVERSRNTVFFQCFGAQEGRKVGSLEMNNCTPLWREAHLDVKTCKAPHVRGLLGVEVEKVHTAVRRSAFPSQNAHNTPCSEHFWKL